MNAETKKAVVLLSGGAGLGDGAGDCAERGV